MKLSFEEILKSIKLISPLITLHFFILLVSSKYGLEKYAAFGDGLEYINLAKALSENPVSVLINIHPPLYPIFIRVFSVLTSYELASLLINAITHTLLIIPLYQVAKLTMTSNHGKLAIMCSTFPPALLTYAGIGLSDTLAIFLSSLFFYFLLRQSEKGMIITSVLAVLTYQIAYLLIIPLGCFYLKRNPWKVYKAFITAIPFISISLYRYGTGQSITYYIDVHFTFAREYWKSRLFSIPFESLIKAMMGIPIKAGGTEHPVSFLSVIYVTSLFNIVFRRSSTVLEKSRFCNPFL